MLGTITVRFIRRRNKGDDTPDRDVISLVDAVKAIAPRDLSIRSMRIEPENNDADFYGVSTEISFSPVDDYHRETVLSTIDSFIPGYLILEDYKQEDWTENPYDLMKRR